MTIPATSWFRRWFGWCWGWTMRCFVIRLLAGALLVALVAGGVATWWFFTTPLPGSHAFTPVETTRVPSRQRQTPEGITYSVNAGPAIVALDMGGEDAASRRVFPSYAAALRHAQANGLATMPSVPLVLAACRSLDARLMSAVERRLEQGDQGRPQLLARWLEGVRRLQRSAAAAPLQSACVRAADHLARAIALGEGVAPVSASGDTASGPWGEAEDLRRIWTRDRHLAEGLVVDDEVSAVAAAVLVRALAADPALSAGWAHQAAVGQVWAGPAEGTTCEQLVPLLASIPDDQLASPAAVAVVRAAVVVGPGQRATVAPAAVAWVGTPEERALASLGAAAWDDPIAALIVAIGQGRLDLTPAAGAGFHRQRWFALETLAAPQRAPETLKLQLSADYVRRWQRAFAAGFSEGRSGLVKRLPVICLGITEQGPIPVAVAPEFTAEPAPVVYLRLARAYRALAAGLEQALGPVEWCALRDSQGAGLAAAITARAEVLFGLAACTYAEVGFPLPRLPEEAAIDAQAAMGRATAWAAAAAEDADVAADARLLVPLLDDEAGRRRCPAVAGVRLEPVEYRWVEEPQVSGNVEPHFVPSRVWLPSPCPLTTTVSEVPTPAAFRARCDGHADVAGLYAAFGQVPPVLRQPRPTWWPLAVLLGCALLGFVVLGWRRLRWRGRLGAAAILASGLAGAGAWLWWAPPYAVVRGVAVAVPALTPNLAIVIQERFHRWGTPHHERLFFALLADPDPQIRYLVGYLPLTVWPRALTPDRWPVLRAAWHDAVPEVGDLAWNMRVHSAEPSKGLIEDLDAVRDDRIMAARLVVLGSRRDDPELVAALVRWSGDARAERRALVFKAVSRWPLPHPAPVVDRARAALGDSSAAVRLQALLLLGKSVTLAGVEELLPMLRDSDTQVRICAMKQIGHLVEDTRSPTRPGRWQQRWSDERLQAAWAGLAADPAVTLDERLSACRYLLDPALRRRLSVALLPAVKALPPYDPMNGWGFGQVFIKDWKCEAARARLVGVWLGEPTWQEGLPVDPAAQEVAQAPVIPGMAFPGGIELLEWRGDAQSWLLARPALAESLADSLEHGGGIAGVLTILEPALGRDQDARAALRMVECLGTEAASLAGSVVAAYHRLGAVGERWQAVCALAALGPTAVDRLTPILQGLVANRDSELNEPAGRLLGWVQQRAGAPP